MSFYVTAIDGGKVYYMAGPYLTHQAALDAVESARSIADKHDPRGCFMAWGTARTDRSKPAPMTAAGLI